MASTCRGCGADILWAKSARGSAIPLDAEPGPSGTMVLEGDGPVAVNVGPPTLFDRRPRYVSHFSTCPQAAEFRRRRKLR
jgi:hypothetical protein